jgi:hypothetical protein
MLLMPMGIYKNTGRNLNAVMKLAKRHRNTAQFQGEKNTQKPMFIKECSERKLPQKEVYN